MNDYSFEEVREGVESILNGIDYHFENYLNLAQEIQHLRSLDGWKNQETWKKDDQIIQNMKHEVTAYFNRLGQFYYFAISETIKKFFPNPECHIPTVKKFLPFRHKQTAHRAIDAPQGENKISMNQLNRLFSTQWILDCGNLVFQLMGNNPGEEGLHFDMLKEHPKIRNEMSIFLKKLDEKV